MLQVDLARAARAHSERLAVVQAVAAAPQSEQETDWVEWKSALDISTPAGAFKVARTILGFGNRDPDHAMNFARGCSYFLVGVEPGNLLGTTVHDAANVEQWLSRYVLRGEPQWSVDSVDVGGKAVMFITVEAPEWGDDILTLQKASPPAKAGDVFVRSNGKTDYATPNDMRRLTARARRADLRLNIGVESWRQQPLTAVTIEPARAKAYAERELERLRPYELARPSMYHVGALMTRETRKVDEYSAEVKEYLTKAPGRYERLAWKQAIDERLASLSLAVNNQTELNFPQTQVTLRLPGDVVAFFDSDDVSSELEDLEPPLPWGQHGIYTLMSPRLGGVLSSLAPKHRNVDYDRDGCQVTLAPVDARPRTRHELDDVYLVVPPSYVGRTIELGWRATSTGAAGDASGTLEVDVTDAVDADALVAAVEAGDE